MSHHLLVVVRLNFDRLPILTSHAIVLFFYVLYNLVKVFSLILLIRVKVFWIFAINFRYMIAWETVYSFEEENTHIAVYE